MTASNQIVFFGNEKLATGISTPEPLIKMALQRAGFVIEQEITGPLDSLGPHQSKLAVLTAYGGIIPPSVLEQFPDGIINVHPSLLPLYRGSSPIEQAILDGISKTGVTIMRLGEELDEGPIYKQKSLLLSGNETKSELALTLQKMGAEQLVSVLPDIARGRLLPRAQPHPDRATYTPRISKSAGKLDWSKPAHRLEREIRAFAGWPGSTARLGEVEVIITKSHVLPENGPVGKLRIESSFGFCIYCAKEALCIDKLKPVGKNEMSVSEFLAGYRNKLT